MADGDWTLVSKPKDDGWELVGQAPTSDASATKPKHTKLSGAAKRKRAAAKAAAVPAATPLTLKSRY